MPPLRVILILGLYLLALLGLLFIALVVGNAYAETLVFKYDPTYYSPGIRYEPVGEKNRDAEESFTLPPGARLIVTSLLPCDGVMHFYDTDGDPQTAEYILVQRTADVSPILVIRYGDGAEGKFEYGQTLSPLKEQKFTTPADLSAVYPTPCAAIQTAGPSTRI